MEVIAWILVFFGIVYIVYIRPKHTTSGFEPTLDKTVGNTEAVCPSCDRSLSKKPARKKKCQHCKNYIYSRTRPFDNQKILIREDQIDYIEEQWAIKNGEHDYYLREKKVKEDREIRIRTELKNRYGKEPADSDVEWKILNERRFNHEQEFNWGFARNVSLEMAKHLEAQSRLERSLAMLFEVAYSDLNGPVNAKHYEQKVAFEKDLSFIAPGIVKRCTKLIKKLKLSNEGAQDLFMQSATFRYNALSSLINTKPEEAWEDFSQGLLEELETQKQQST